MHFIRHYHSRARLSGHLCEFHSVGIVQTINRAFDGVSIPDWADKLVTVGADGAAVNMGKRGVVALLQKEKPHLLGFHCLPH